MVTAKQIAAHRSGGILPQKERLTTERGSILLAAGLAWTLDLFHRRIRPKSVTEYVFDSDFAQTHKTVDFTHEGTIVPRALQR
jgi:hypothetical protein